MTDALFLLAEIGRASVQPLWVPLALWTAVALAAEGALRVSRADADAGLPVRRAVLAALPVSVALPALVAAVAPDAAAVVPALPTVLWLPEVVVGEAPAVPDVALVPGDVLLGLLTLAAAAAGLLALVRFAHGALRLRAVRRSLPAAPPAVAARLDSVRQRLGVERPVAAAVAPAGAAPFTLGWRRPVVAVPAGLAAEALDVALVHELAHVRRSDFAWHVAERAVAAAFAAHPLVHALARGLDLDRERAADAAVLEAWPDRRRVYADLLLSYASLPAPRFALAAAAGSSSLKHRIHAMTRPTSPRRRRRLARAGRLAGVLALALVAGLAAATAPAPPATPTTPTDAPTPVQVASDSIAAAIESIEVRKPEGAPGEIHVYLKPGASEADAEAVADGVAEAPGEDLLAVHYEGGIVERRVQLGDRAASPLPPNMPTLPAPPAPGRVSPELIESVDVNRQSGLLIITVTMKPEATTSDAEQFADDMAARGRADVVRVRLADGRVVERRRTETGRRSLAPADTTDEVFEVAEVQPVLIGGLEALQRRVVYPEAAKEAGASGRAIVQFVVDTDGSVIDEEVVRSSGNDALDEAALAATRGSRFEPGLEGGEPVKVRFALPITFRLPPESGEDQGQNNLPSSDELRQRLPYSGTDLALLQNNGLINFAYQTTLTRLDRSGAAGGTVEVEYVIQPDGTTSDIAIVRDTADGKLGVLARSALVERMRFDESRRPTQPQPASFRITYHPPG